MTNIINMNTFDPFKDDEEGEQKEETNNIVHLRIQQRNGRKCITIVEGLQETKEVPLKKLTKHFRKSFNCSATLVDDKGNNNKKVIQLSGDKRNDISDYLIKNKIVEKNKINIHGY